MERERERERGAVTVSFFPGHGEALEGWVENHGVPSVRASCSSADGSVPTIPDSCMHAWIVDGGIGCRRPGPTRRRKMLWLLARSRSSAARFGRGDSCVRNRRATWRGGRRAGRWRRGFR
jgi:hypothetical protein